MASIYQAVRVIAVYLLFSSVLLGILQESPYKPYVRLFTSLLLVLLMVRAFSFLSLDADIERILEQAVDADDFFEQLKEAEQMGQDKIQEQILEELKEKAVVVAAGFGYQVSGVEIELKLAEEDTERQNYQIKAIELELNGAEEGSADREQLKAALAEYFFIGVEDIVIKEALKSGGGAYGQMDRGSWQGDYFVDKGAVKGEAGSERN